MDSLGKIIARNRKLNKLKQQDLAEALNKYNIRIKKNAVCAWENDISQPNASQIFAVCQVLGITDIYTEFIGTNPDNPLAELNKEGRTKALDYIRLLILSGEYKKETSMPIPFPVERCLNVYDLPVSAGTGNMFLDGSKATVNIDSSVIPNEASYGVIVSGDSMEPEFHSGEIAWVSQQDTLCDGEIGIFGLNNEAYIKKLKRYADRLYLVSLNSKYSPIEIKESDRLDVFRKVVGKINSNDVPDYRF